MFCLTVRSTGGERREDTINAIAYQFVFLLLISIKFRKNRKVLYDSVCLAHYKFDFHTLILQQVDIHNYLL